MKIAIVGEGLAALSSAYHLLIQSPFSKIDIYSIKTPEMASNMSSGLMHPFVSNMSRLNYAAQSAYHESCLLIHEIQKHSKAPIFLEGPIFKLFKSDTEKKMGASVSSRAPRAIYHKAHSSFEGVSALEIYQGKTVFMKTYLQALKNYLKTKGVCFYQKEIREFKNIDSYDKTLFAVGAGIKNFELKEKFQYLKGQLLVAKLDNAWPTSFLARGYVAKGLEEGLWSLGSTYERHFQNADVDQKFAEEMIIEKLSNYVSLNNYKLKEVEAGVRVIFPKDHLPKIIKKSHDVYVLAALGSRGLLYHALLGNLTSKFLITGSIDKGYSCLYQL